MFVASQRAWFAAAGRGRLCHPALARRMARRRAQPCRAEGDLRGTRPRRCAAAAALVRLDLPRLCDAARMRQRRATGALSAAHPGGRNLVPGLFRTRRRVRPRRSQMQGRAERATSMSSTARKSGRPWRNMPTNACCWCAPPVEGAKQAGITYLLMDMKAPGVTVRPIHQIQGDEEFAEIFLDNVEVPVSRAGRRGRPGLGGGADHACLRTRADADGTGLPDARHIVAAGGADPRSRRAAKMRACCAISGG